MQNVARESGLGFPECFQLIYMARSRLRLVKLGSSRTQQPMQMFLANRDKIIQDSAILTAWEL
jgi:hypothetical protein